MAAWRRWRNGSASESRHLAAAVPATPGSFAASGSTNATTAFCEEVDRRNQLADERDRDRRGLRLCASFQCEHRQDLQAHAVEDTRHRAAGGCSAGERVSVPATLSPTVSLAGHVGFLAARATPGVEAVEGQSYRRSISLNGEEGHFEITHDEEHQALLARVRFGDPSALFLIIERIRAMFDLNADWAAIARNLKSDPVMAKRVEVRSRPAGAGLLGRLRTGGARSLGQQVSVAAATCVAGRLVRILRASAGEGEWTYPPFPERNELVGGAPRSVADAYETGRNHPLIGQSGLQTERFASTI